MGNSFGTYWRTLRHLKLKQIWFQIYNRITGIRGPRSVAKSGNPKGQLLHFKNPISAYITFSEENTFQFLNIQQAFGQNIDWNFPDHGKLWTYNLTYFDFLLQPSMTQEIGLGLMKDFARKYDTILDGHEPYPTSLRIMNWIKFVSFHRIENETIEGVIYTDMLRLDRNLEYHLLGNHLLENGFALLWGGVYFKNPKVLKVASQLLLVELEEQIEANGAHFEYAPMYHSIILSRVLESIQLLKENQFPSLKSLEQLLVVKGTKMLAWLKRLQLSSGELVHYNDSIEGISPTPNSLIALANTLGIRAQKPSESPFQYFVSKSNYHLFINAKEVGPSYIPGHAHSQLFHFILHHHNQPVIVDTGISTYNKTTQRQIERSVESHNTVQVGKADPNEVWGGFRVGKRAQVIITDETENSFTAQHNGYADLGITHHRSFEWSEKQINITDHLSKSGMGKAYLHFHPDVNITVSAHQLLGDFGTIEFSGDEVIKLEKYSYAYGFNHTAEATVAVIEFSKKLTTTISLS